MTLTRGVRLGSYEIVDLEFTFVAEDSSGTQWEEDPEFDTGN